MQSVNVYDNLKIGLGDYGNLKSGLKFGKSTVGTTVETVWSAGGIYVYPDKAGEIVYLSSDDANDADQGTGLWDVTVSGLDENWDLYSENVLLAGLTQVATKKKFARVFRMQGLHGGSVDGQIGSIYCGTSPAVAGVPPVVYAELTLAAIQPNQTQMAMLSVPRGHKLAIADFALGVFEGKKTAFFLATRLPFEDDSVWQYKANFNVKSVSQERAYTYPIIAEEFADVEARAITETGTEEVTVSFSYLFSENRT